ncbi:MAG: hypothetical protein GXO08_05360, partial [Aquificae bacterium]|nr:hypothetical protein [Aquificota bacterium]
MRGGVKTLLLGVPLLLWASNSTLDYAWEARGEKYRLVLFLDQDLCGQLSEGDLFLFITPEGKVYKRTIRRKPRNCKLYKYFS